MINPIRFTLANTYSYSQNTPATVWNVQHNLGKTPIIEVLINNPDSGHLEKAIPGEIKIITENLIRVTFSVAFSGKVRVIA
jgi:hypothetical protein